jgi:Ca-activated chloride channel family protein
MKSGRSFSGGTASGLTVVLALAVGVALLAQSPAPTPAPAGQQPAPAPQAAPAQAPPSRPAAQEPAPASQPSIQRPSFRSGVDVVSLNVTVTDQSRQFVTSLEQSDFVVYEDGVKQDLTYFNKAQLPVALSLLIDTSASMEDKLRLAQEAAIGFVRRMKPEDIAQIIDFDSRVSILQQFTGDKTLLENGIRQTVPNGSTSLHNAIYISLKELKKVRATSSGDVRRQAIVVLSDGEDTSSLVPFEEVLDLAKRSEVIVYAIGIRGRDLGARGFPEAEFVLKQFAQETGGKAFFPTAANELDGIYAQIADELAAQYALAYSSRNPRRDGQWRRIVVRTTNPQLAARTKQGYFGPVN